MDKINIHDSLRIYLPGLMLSMLIFVMITGKIDSISTVAVPAIFVGLLLDMLFEKLHKNYYIFLGKQSYFGPENKFDFIEAWHQLVLIQLKLKGAPCEERLRKLNPVRDRDRLIYIAQAFFNRCYSAENLSYFRSPKSFAILCYNAFLVCVIGLLLATAQAFAPLIGSYRIPIQPFFLSYFLVITGFIFLIGSRTFFLQSFNRELVYWSTLSDEEVQRIDYLIQVSEQLTEGNTDQAAEQS